VDCYEVGANIYTKEPKVMKPSMNQQHRSFLLSYLHKNCGLGQHLLHGRNIFQKEIHSTDELRYFSRILIVAFPSSAN
jgi:hypothetical protein